MASESRRDGLPAIVRHEILVEKGSRLEKILITANLPYLGGLVDAPTDVVSLYLEKVNNGTLDQQSLEAFRWKLEEILQ